MKTINNYERKSFESGKHPHEVLSKTRGVPHFHMEIASGKDD